GLRGEQGDDTQRDQHRGRICRPTVPGTSECCSSLIPATGVDGGRAPAWYAHVDRVPARLLAGCREGDLVPAAELLERLAKGSGEPGAGLAVADAPAGLGGQVAEES